MADQPDKSLMGTRGVAQMTGLSMAHIRRLLAAGEKLRGYKLNSWTWLVERAEVERFHQERQERKSRRRRR